MTRKRLQVIADVETSGDGYRVFGHDAQPPRTYGDCAELKGVCPWARCRYNLMVDVDEDDGALGLNFNRVMSEVSRREARVVSERPRDFAERDDPGPMLDALVSWWTDVETTQPTCAIWWAENGGGLEEKGLTLEEVGDLLNVTRERVRQIETRAQRRLAEELGQNYEIDELAQGRHALEALSDEAME